MHLPEKPSLKKETKDLVSIPQPCNMHLIEDREFFSLENCITSVSQTKMSAKQAFRSQKAAVKNTENKNTMSSYPAFILNPTKKKSLNH